MRAHAPSRKTAMICLILFVLGLIGVFIPLGHVAVLGPVLHLVNQLAVYLLIGGYGLLLVSIYI
jgi:hypothetical protein